jgi:hypothetical protein
MHFSVMSRSHRTTYDSHNYTSHDMKFSIVKRCLFQIIRCNCSVFPRYALFVMAMINSPRKGDPGADVLSVNTSKIQYCPVCSTLSASHFGAIRQTDTEFFHRIALFLTPPILLSSLFYTVDGRRRSIPHF